MFFTTPLGNYLQKPIMKTSRITLHPKAQVIITGKPLTPEQAQEVTSFTENLSVDGWCGSDGTIGHIDSVKPEISYEKLYGDLMELAQRFWFLELGVSVMSGPPGTFTQ